MIDGRYYKTYPRFFEWTAPKLDLITRADKYIDVPFRTCGTAAVSLITNLNPKFVESHIPKSRRHWTDTAIKKFLNNRGYKMFPLTKNGVTSIDGLYYEAMPLTNKHCILINSLVCKNEASYFILHGGRYYHNFEYDDLDPLLLINKPTQSAYVIYHPRWSM